MTSSFQSPQPTQDIATDVEVVKNLEQRGIQGIDTLSLEELQLLTERKRKQLHQEALEKKAQLENEISSIEQQIQELGARKVALTEELDAHLKSIGLSASGGERPAKRSPRKPKAVETTQLSPTSEANGSGSTAE